MVAIGRDWDDILNLSKQPMTDRPFADMARCSFTIIFHLAATKRATDGTKRLK
jgi:hypothetical protein